MGKKWNKKKKKQQKKGKGPPRDNGLEYLATGGKGKKHFPKKKGKGKKQIQLDQPPKNCGGFGLNWKNNGGGGGGSGCGITG